MQFGVVLPNLATFGDDLPDRRGLVAFARAARDHGFTSAWAADHIMHAAPSLDAALCLQVVADAVPELSVGFASMPAFLRHPLAAAKLIFSLDILTDGRLEVALSIGDERPEMRALGIDPAERGRRLDETLAILTRVATEPEATYQGRFYTFERARIAPKPRGRRLPPLFIASWTGTASQRRILEYGCGWMASGLFSTEENLRRGMADLRGAAAVEGKPPLPTILTNVLTCISEDAATLDRARALLGGNAGVLAGVRGLRLIGTRPEVRDRLTLIRSLGFDRVNVLPVGFDPAQLEAFMGIV